MTLINSYWNLKIGMCQERLLEWPLEKLVREQVPDEALRRMSMHQEYADD